MESVLETRSNSKESTCPVIMTFFAGSKDVDDSKLTPPSVCSIRNPYTETPSIDVGVAGANKECHRHVLVRRHNLVLHRRRLVGEDPERAEKSHQPQCGGSTGHGFSFTTKRSATTSPLPSGTANS
jgi:hypothetical protein